MKELKEIHKKVYDYIRQRTQEGYSPSIREICRDLGIASTSTAARYVNYLISEGYLEKMEGKKRAVKLAGDMGMRLPVAGTITAGQPITAVENIDGYISFQPMKSHTGELFALRVRGDSMINAGIFDGDYAVVEKCGYVDNGEIAAVLVDGESATVKRFYKENGHYRLEPENDSMQPIIADECSIIGKIVGIVRYL
ncbi:MAG: transcriptional repressor LexA [Ruminococcus sp.]|nr:transcriptional repressor LexA [Ruminococcus sp.]